MFIFFKRNDNCIFLGIIPSFKLMVFSCRQTICFQQQLNELYHLGYDLQHYHAQHHAFIKQFNLPEYFRFDAA